jgi:hypothetical protein
MTIDLTETGAINSVLMIPQQHDIGRQLNTGGAQATSGSATCGSSGAAAVNQCILGGNCSVSIGVSTGGVGFTFPPSNIWNTTHPYSLVCGAQTVPAAPPANVPCQPNTPQPPPNGGGYYYWSTTACSWQYQSCADLPPIVIDTDGSGFQLTSAPTGVLFDFYGNARLMQISWTASGSTNGWLALDRNGNGTIDSAKELFGNITDQPTSSDPNGFQALAVFDLPENGGNGDGVIDSQDSIWPKLLVWIDANHDGISQPGELQGLASVGIRQIDLVYKLTPFTDQYGNRFRYKGSLKPLKDDDVDRVIYDVFLLH